MYLQLLIGIVLLFISPMVNYGKGMMKNEALRFYGLEHPLMMLIAVAIVSIGLYRGRKKKYRGKEKLNHIPIPCGRPCCYAFNDSMGCSNCITQ